MMDRRAFLTMVGGSVLAAPFAVEAHQAGKISRIGWLADNSAATRHLREAFDQGIRDLDYLEGRNLVIEHRYAEGLSGSRAHDPSVGSGTRERDHSVMNRRTFLCGLTLGTLGAPLAAGAQPVGRTVTIGYLGNSSPSHESHLVEAFREGLHQLGYVEGRNLAIKYAWAEGRPNRFSVLARELVDLKPDVILTSGTPGALAAKQATQSIPIVMAVVGNPLEVGLVSSLAKPGGNATGLSALGAELEGKRLEFLTQAFPKLSRAAVLLNPDNPFTAIAWKSPQPAAESVGVALQRFEVRGPNDLDHALGTIRAARPQALMVTPDRLLLTYREPIVQFVTKNRLAAMFPYREFAEEGGLMTYGPDYVDMFRRAATYVDKIIKGAKPADLPVEKPTKFELVINMKTAKALGLTIPQTLLLRADQVIE